MKPRLKSTPAARDLIKAHQPFLPTARQEADGAWKVGYGHRAAAKQGVSVSEADASLLLIYDVLQAEKAIDESVKGELGAPQRDALVSFALGIGLPAFRRSAIVRLIGKGRWRDAADAIAAWNGGGSERHAAERDLFLKDLPKDTRSTPVELVIEFDHPDEEEAVAPVINADSAPETTQDMPATVPETIGEEEKAEPVLAATPAGPQRSELAERVIARMQAQLSGPIRETAYAARGAAAAEEAVQKTDPAPVEDGALATAGSAAFRGPLGYAFTQSADMDDELPADADDGEDSASADADPDETPPPVIDPGLGASGEVSGQGLTDDDDETSGSETDETLPQPEEIDTALASNGKTEKSNGWTNGDATPAPGKNGGHLGEIILLIFGLILLAGGIWDLSTQPGGDAEEPNLFIGLSALVVGFIFAVGAAIWLIGARKK
ncbi:lysozyme [Hyphobacterium sp.]|uniref:lysozyme n=1 Tax=Hyphobacterium sp. TaxID=2004662 RepID=UPI003BAC0198